MTNRTYRNRMMAFHDFKQNLEGNMFEVRNKHDAYMQNWDYNWGEEGFIEQNFEYWHVVEVRPGTVWDWTVEEDDDPCRFISDPAKHTGAEE